MEVATPLLGNSVALLHLIGIRLGRVASAHPERDAPMLDRHEPTPSRTHVLSPWAEARSRGWREPAWGARLVMVDSDPSQAHERSK
jgi:hypothetical protein